MIAIDTNVLVRFLVNDDAAQFERARELINENTIFVSSTVLLETEWVLRETYEFPKVRVLDALVRFLNLDRVTAESPGAAKKALRWAAEGMDFADALHLACASSCRAFASFDRKLSRRAAKLDAVAVITPLTP